MATKQVRRTMLANIKPGEHVSYVIVQRNKPVRVEAEVTRIESEYNLGRLWTTQGPLPWQPPTAKYEIRS